jgi:hypothetical protein
MRTALGATVGFVVLLMASPAMAAQRYAAPEGKGASPCEQAAPCPLTTAVNSAVNGDEVIVEPGSYTLPSALFPIGTNLYIHGNLGQPMPIINGSTSGSLVNVTEGSRLAYLAINNTAATTAYAFGCTKNSTVERVNALAIAGSHATGGLAIETCTVKDSLIRAQGPESRGLAPIGNGVTFGRNLTVVASGTASVGATVTESNHALDIRNTILLGDEASLKLEGNGSAFVGNSFVPSPVVKAGSSLVDLGGNLTSPPLFVDAAHGDYREAAGSPTIDAGVVDRLGTLDLAGNPRVVGPAPDIGAYEFVPPVVVQGQIQSLTVKPKSFKASAKKGGATVSYSLSAAATVEFKLERKAAGRKAGKKCVKKTAKNAGKKKCALIKPVKGSFSASGNAGANSFKFSGLIGGKALKPGSYKLIGSAGGASKSASFAIVK